MVLTKTPITYDRMTDLGLELTDVNLGGMGIRGERTPFIRNVACSPDEITAIKNLMAKKCSCILSAGSGTAGNRSSRLC